MLTLRIRHRTTYLYHAPVRLGPHRLMLRPRESRELRLVSHEVTVTPAVTMTWAHDVFGNAVATASFEGTADRLVVDSEAELVLGADSPLIADKRAGATQTPGGTGALRLAADEVAETRERLLQEKRSELQTQRWQKSNGKWQSSVLALLSVFLPFRLKHR